MIQKKEWEAFFERNAATEWYPSEPVIRLLCSYRKKHGAKDVRVLDLGCGNGRHAWLAAKEGFTIYGVDLSAAAIRLAREWLDREGLSYGELIAGNIADPLPYADGFFDIVLSYGALDHMPLPLAERARDEAKRVLKPGGTIFLKLESNTSFTFDPTKQDRKNEIILDKKAEPRILQHFFDREEVAKFVEDFKPIQFFRDDYRRFEDMDKNYQSRWIFIGKKA